MKFTCFMFRMALFSLLTVQIFAIEPIPSEPPQGMRWMRANLCTAVSASPPLIQWQVGKLAADGNFYSPTDSHVEVLAFFGSIDAGTLFLWGNDGWGAVLNPWGNINHDLDKALASLGDYPVGAVGSESVWVILQALTFQRIESKDKDQIANLSSSTDTSLQPKPDKNMLGSLPAFGGGLVADGVTPWIIKASGIKPGNYTLTFDAPTEGSIANLQGRIRSLKGSSWITGKTINLTSASDAAYFYLEGIPTDDVTFADGSTEVTATARLTGNGKSFAKSFKVRKPPVVLVHGIFSNNRTWKPNFLGPLEAIRGTAEQQSEAPFVIPVSYADPASSAEIPFLRLASLLNIALENIESQAGPWRKKWAFTRYDVVGHSQGGVLLRMLCQNTKSSSSAAAFSTTKFVSETQNFNRGRFRRIITIGSPHNGTYLARYVSKLNIPDDSSGIRRALPEVLRFFVLDSKFDPFREQIDQIDDEFYPVDERAKFHLIGSTIGPSKLYDFLGLGTNKLPQLFPKGSDGLVDFDSQTAAVSSKSSFSSVSHAAPEFFFGVAAGETDTASGRIGSEVARLIDASDSEFSAFSLSALAPLRDPGIRRTIDALATSVRKTDIQPSTSAFRSNSTVLGTPQQTRYRFRIIPAASDPPAEVVTWYVEVRGLGSVTSTGTTLDVDSADSTNVAVTVDSTVEGEVVLYGSYRSTSGNLVFGKPILVATNPVNATLTGISIAPSTISMVKGKTFLPELETNYAEDLTKTEFIGPDTEINATSSDEAVVSVERAGFKLLAKAPGTATVTVHYRGYETVANIVVEAAHPGSVGFAATSFTAEESAGKAEIEVQRTGGTDGAVTVHYSTADGSAIAGQNYTAVEGELTIPDGDISGTITILLINDNLFQTDKTFNVALSDAAGGATLGIATSAIVTKHDDDSFLPKIAIYRGLTLPASSRTSATTGGISFSLTGKGSFTGRFVFGGKTLGLRGQFDSHGFATFSIPRRGMATLIVDMQMDDGGDVMAGTVSDGIETVELSGDRAAFDTLHPTSLAGKYTLIFPPDPADKGNADVPQGSGYGTMTVSKAGLVNVSAVLGDNMRFGVRTLLSKNGTLPIYRPLYAKAKGAIAGELQFVTKPGVSDAEGVFYWFKPISPHDKRFSIGFSTISSVVGSRYVAPTQGAFALQELNATSGHADVTLSNGNLSQLSRAVTVSNQNQVSVVFPAQDKLHFSLNAKLGSMSGSFFAPGAQAATTFKGVLFQQSSKSIGLFLGPSQSGTIELVPTN